MAVSINWGGLRLLQGGLGLMSGRFRADTYKNYMAVSIHLDPLTSVPS